MEESTSRAGTAEGSLRSFLTRDLKIRDHRDIQLLEYLARGRKLKREEIKTFCAEAREQQQTIGEHAVVEGMIDEREMLQLLGNLYRMDVVDLSDAEIDKAVTDLFSSDRARMLAALPYGRSSRGEILIAIADPGQDNITEDLASAFPGERIVLQLTSPSQLALTIDTTYRLRDLTIDNTIPDENIRIEAYDSEGPAIQTFDELLTRAIQENASDIHIEPRDRDYLVRFRVDGRLYDASSIDPSSAQQLVTYIKNASDMEKSYDKRSLQDGRFSREVMKRRIDMRVVSTPVIGNPGETVEQVVLRLQDPLHALLTLTELGMSPQNYKRYIEAIQRPYGFALIVGPTGSGKTTTLYASLRIVVKPEVKVISIEDPVELKLPGGVNQIEIPRGGRDNLFGFSDALESVVRCDPDIIMVGEIRDPETAKLAINASITGHFVYSTLHANSALTTIIRLSELKVDSFLISEALEIIVAQRLVRRVCTKCAESYEPSFDEMRTLRIPEEEIDLMEKEGHSLVLKRAHPKGCQFCHGRGYRGRIGIHEMLTVSPEIRQAILEHASLRALEPLARKAGMTSLREDGWEKVKLGITTMEELNTEAR